MCWYFFFFFFKQKTAYEMRISDWSSDVCSSDLRIAFAGEIAQLVAGGLQARLHLCPIGLGSARLHLGIARDAPGGADQQVEPKEHFASPPTFFLMSPPQPVAPLCSYPRTDLLTQLSCTAQSPDTAHASYSERVLSYL